MKINELFHNDERWQRYPKLPNRFLISNHGRIYSFSSNGILKTSIDKYGYERISIIVGSRKNKTRKHLNLKVHQMVAATFIGGKPEKDWTVNHKDGNKLNNRQSNLEWCSSSDNLKHGWRTGLFKNVYKN